MFNEIWRKRIRPYVAPDTRRGRFGIAVVTLYLVASAASIVLGLSGHIGPDNVLGAEVEWDASGSGRLVVRNLGRDDWTSLRVDLDERFYTELDGVPRSQTLTLTGVEWSDGYLLPRAGGLFLYERIHPREERAAPGIPSGYRPRRVTVRADQGVVSADL